MLLMVGGSEGADRRHCRIAGRTDAENAEKHARERAFAVGAGAIAEEQHVLGGEAG
jgi:hypothetical protein